MNSDTAPTLDLRRKANFGYTEHGSAIVDAVWFNGAYTSDAQAIGMVLIVDQSGCWKAYIGSLSYSVTEAADAQRIAAMGAKVPYPIAAGAFPNRFLREDYDRID